MYHMYNIPLKIHSMHVSKKKIIYNKQTMVPSKLIIIQKTIALSEEIDFIGHHMGINFVIYIY